MIRRRDFLRSGGIAAVLAGVGVGVGEVQAKTKPGAKWAMIIDLNRCSGCGSCVIACKAHNKTVDRAFLTTVVNSETGEYPNSRDVFTPIQCNQCEDPPCVEACAEKATFRLDNGIVVTDWNLCNGDGRCVEACPYQARILDSRHGNRVDKCDFCLNRIDRGLTPACVEACPQNARVFGDLATPSPELKAYTKRKDLAHRKADLKLASRVWYISSIAVD